MSDHLDKISKHYKNTAKLSTDNYSYYLYHKKLIEYSCMHSRHKYLSRFRKYDTIEVLSEKEFHMNMDDFSFPYSVYGACLHSDAIKLSSPYR